MARLTVVTLNNFSPIQIGELNRSQVQSLTAPQLNGLSTANFQALNLANLTSVQLGNLTNAVANLSAGQINALTASQIGALSVPGLNHLSSTQSANTILESVTVTSRRIEEVDGGCTARRVESQGSVGVRDFRSSASGNSGGLARLKACTENPDY